MQRFLLTFLDFLPIVLFGICAVQSLRTGVLLPFSALSEFAGGRSLTRASKPKLFWSGTVLMTLYAVVGAVSLAVGLSNRTL